MLEEINKSESIAFLVVFLPNPKQKGPSPLTSCLLTIGDSGWLLPSGPSDAKQRPYTEEHSYEAMRADKAVVGLQPR